MNPVHPDTLHTYVREVGGIMDGEQAAAYLGVSRRTVQRWLKDGKLPGLKRGRMPPCGVGHPRMACVLAETEGEP